MLIWSIQYAQYTQLGIIVQVNDVGDGDCDSDGDADEDWGKTNQCDEEAYDSDTNDNYED